MLAEHGPEREFLNMIANAPVEVDQWQLEKLALATAKAEVLYYVPGLPCEYHTRLGGKILPHGWGRR